MIKLTKGPEPFTLKNNSATWTTELLSFKQKGLNIPDSLKNNYNQMDIKDALRVETNGHCMYCESPINHVSPEHIEHIKPKALDKFPELTFTWTNLGLACPVCNINKGDNYDPAMAFINPYAEEPKDFISVFGALLYHKAASERGEYTVGQLQLNRASLLERRKERLDLICGLLDKCINSKNLSLKKLMLNQIKIETSAGTPFSLFTRAFAKARLKEVGESL